jgi:pyruvate/2-oxoglutarate dehydrogenase complex dihydrolipoamide acyltransferase (E2) component
MSAEQKQAMRQAMMASQQMIAGFTSAPAQDKAAVMPHMEELQREFEDEN